MRRPRPLLIGRSGPDRLMPVIIAPMAYIAALALVVVGLAQDLAQEWRAGLDGVLTVEIPPGADFAETEARVGTAVRVLHARPEVAGVQVITAEGADRMLQQWVGDAIDLSGFPLPILLDVRLTDGAGGGEAAVAALQEAVPEALPIDAGGWLDDLRELVEVVEVAAAAVLGLAVAAAVATVIAVSAANFAVWRSIVELLHVMGAEDRFVARAFQAAAFRQAGIGALVGVSLAVASILGVAWAIDRVDPLLHDLFDLSWWSWSSLALVPVATAVLAMLAARLTVLVALRRMG